MGSSQQNYGNCWGALRSALLRSICVGLVGGTVLMGASDVVHADSLAKALSHAYLDNPILEAERARQRATDELEPQANAGWRPTVEASVSVAHSWIHEKPRGKKQTDPGVMSIGLSQPLFRGFRTINQTKRARVNIAAGRQELLAVEQQVLLNAATAYMDVIRDREILRLRRGQVSLLREELRGARGRFNLGEKTRTDVAQAKARLNRAIGNLEGAVANLSVSVGLYTRAIGHAPKVLTRPRVSPRVPKSLEQALARGERLNPELLGALQKEQAADLLVDIKYGELLPQLKLQAEYKYQEDPSTVLTSSEDATIRGILSIPIYQAGVRHSAIREAKHLANRKRLMTLDSKRKVRNQIVRLWSRYKEAGRKLATTKVEIGAAMVALQGVRREATFGNRTTLDILDAERELLVARERLEAFRHAEVISAYKLISAVGGMTASNLRLSVAAYDPLENYDATRNRWFGTGISTD